jgi:hypothetical protein
MGKEEGERPLERPRRRWEIMFKCWISRSHNGDYKNLCLLGCNAVWAVKSTDISEEHIVVSLTVGCWVLGPPGRNNHFQTSPADAVPFSWLRSRWVRRRLRVI